MSPRLRRMSGEEAIGIFIKLGFVVSSQRGSHVKLVRVTAEGQRQVLTIPNHKGDGPRNATSYCPASGQICRAGFAEATLLHGVELPPYLALCFSTNSSIAANTGSLGSLILPMIVP